MGQQDILEARKSELLDSIKTILDTADGEARGITDAEQIEIDGHHAEIRATDTKLASYTAVKAHLDERGRNLDASKGTALVIDVPEVPAIRTELRNEPYAKGAGGSFFLDLAKAKDGDFEARERLTVQTKFRASNDQGMEKRAGATTVAGAGGEFSPPSWVESDFIAYVRPGRVFADRLNKKPLPQGISSINLPKVTGGTAVASQSNQNTAINVQDMTTGSVSTTFSTLAGGTIVSLQLLRQSGVSIDDVVIQDLGRDYARKLDAAAITAVAGAGTAVTYTSGSPTSLAISQYVQQAIDAVSTAVFEGADTIIMHPVRWGKLIAYGDSTGRPLVLPSTSYGPMNAIGLANGQNAQGYAGNFRGLDVYLDANIPVNLGAGTNQDEIFVLKADEVYLYESGVEFKAFEETYANTASVFIRAVGYYGIIPNRYPGAISVLGGTGLASTLTYGA